MLDSFKKEYVKNHWFDLLKAIVKNPLDPKKGIKNHVKDNKLNIVKEFLFYVFGKK